MDWVDEGLNGLDGGMKCLGGMFGCLEDLVAMEGLVPLEGLDGLERTWREG